MPAPIFLRFAILCEKAKVTIADAADALGINIGQLHALEEFIRTPDPLSRVKSHKSFRSPLLYARLAEVVRAYMPDVRDSDVSLFPALPADADTIFSMLRADAFYHACIPYLANVFIDFRFDGRGYQMFFNTFVRHLLCLDQINPAVIHAPHDPTTAHALDYALNRVWGPTRKKRKSARYDPGIYYQSTGKVEPGQPLGVFEGVDAWRVAFWNAEAYPDRKPYFAYLVLYICLKKIVISFEKSQFCGWPAGWCHKLFDQPSASAPPAGAILVLNTPVGEVTVFFRTLFALHNDFYLVRGDAIS